MIALITAVAGLALVLRVIGLDSQLWLDEMFALKLIREHAPGELFTVFGNDTNHVLYTALAGLSVSWFGEHAWSLRLPALLFGVMCVPATYLLGSLVASRREGALAAMLLTVSYHHVWFSQNARGYTAVACFTLVATYCFMRGTREQSWTLFVGYAVALALAVYVHLGVVFLILGHVALCLVWAATRSDRPGPRAWRQPAVGLVLAIVLGSLLYSPMSGELAEKFRIGGTGPGTSAVQARESTSAPRPGIAARLAGRATVILHEWKVGLQVLELGLGAHVGLGIAGLVLACGTWSFARTNPVFLAAFLLPALATLGGSLIMRSQVFPRYFFFLIGLALIVAARGAMVVGGGLHRLLGPGTPAQARITWGVGTALVLVAGSTFALRHNYQLPKMDFLGAVEYVERHRGPEDPVVVTGGAAAQALREFYGKPWPRIGTAEDLERVRSLGRDVWLVFTLPSGGSMLSVTNVAARECSEWRVFKGSVGDGDIRVCRFAAR